MSVKSKSSGEESVVGAKGADSVSGRVATGVVATVSSSFAALWASKAANAPSSNTDFLKPLPVPAAAMPP